MVGVEGSGSWANAYASSTLLRLSPSSENLGAPVWLAISRRYFLLALISMAVMGACGFAAAVGDPVGVVVGVCVGLGLVTGLGRVRVWAVKRRRKRSRRGR